MVRTGVADHALAALCLLAAAAIPRRVQQDSTPPRAVAVVVPKLWDEQALATWATPLAGINALPNFYSEAEYYAAPVDNLRTYPVYDPDREPPGYMDWLAKQEPMRLIEPEKLHTKEDWIAAGREVFDGLDLASFRTDDPAAIAWFHDRAAIAKDPPVATREGIYPLFRWVIDVDRKLKLTSVNCSSCHGHVRADGTRLRGAPSNVFGGGELPFDACLDASDRLFRQTRGVVKPGEIYYREYGVPWVPDDVHARYRTVEKDEEFAGADDFAGETTFARFNGSPFWTTRFSDLIGVKDQRYLDATGTHANRGPEDLARYGILVEFADDGSVGPYRIMTGDERRLRLRPPDEAMYALALFLYSLEHPASPHPFNALAARGQEVFRSERCGICHMPPLYTDNKLIAVDGFEPPQDDPNTQPLRISTRRVGTDPGLALKTRKGTGYYKVPTLRGLWYRGPLEHSGSIATLEDWFDPNRLRQDYVPTGWKGPGVTTRPVPGHEFGLDLPADDKRALIAFLRTL